MTFSIEGKTAVVTGAGSGVGLAIARHFLSRGANVMFADPDEDALEREVSALGSDAARARLFAANPCEKLAVANLLSATLDSFDRVDILVNGYRRMEPSDAMNADDDGVLMLLNQNLMTALRLTQTFGRRMIRQAEESGDDEAPAGSIINLSSIAARRTQPELLGYSVASAALDQMTRSMAVALAPHRIRVNAIALGSVMSASLQGALRDHDEFREEIIDSTPLGRIAGADELAEVAQFLASEGSAFMTGQILTVDGGRTLVDAVHVPAH
jgi:7-alpha-hydroxysteroid dehydrogenase